MYKDGDLAMVKYKPTSNRTSRSERRMHWLQNQWSENFSAVKTITRQLPKIAKPHILILNRYVQRQRKFL